MSQNNEMFEKIREDLNERMSKYKDSRHPTDEEVTIAWLITEVDRLRTLSRLTMSTNNEGKKEELVKAITGYVYPTTQVFTGQITPEEYIISIAEFFANELFDRRMDIQALPLFAELGVVLDRIKKEQQEISVAP